MERKALATPVLMLCASIIAILSILSACAGKSQITVHTVSSTSIEEGLRIIGSQFPDLTTNLKFVTNKYNSDKSTHWLEYSSVQAEFQLNSETQKVDTFFLKSKNESSDPKIAAAKAQELAVQYISKYRPDFDLTVMRQTGPGYVDYGSRKFFSFEWREFRDDVDIGHAITIELAPDGDLNGFAVAQSQYADIDTKAGKMTYEQAVDIVKKYLQPKIQADRYNALRIKESKLVVFKGKVCWIIELASKPSGSEPIEYYYFITIDAQSGKVMDDSRG